MHSLKYFHILVFTIMLKITKRKKAQNLMSSSWRNESLFLNVLFIFYVAFNGDG